jgi:hypothetical protein
VTRSFRATTLKKHALNFGMIDQRQKAALKTLEIFESLDDSEISFDIRLGLAAQIAESRERLDIETRLLTLASLLRWLHRSNQKHLALTVLEDYQSLNLRLTHGQRKDIFGFLDGDLSSTKFLQDLHMPESKPLPSKEDENFAS